MQKVMNYFEFYFKIQFFLSFVSMIFEFSSLSFRLIIRFLFTFDLKKGRNRFAKQIENTLKIYEICFNTYEREREGQVLEEKNK